jgi:hypothetical protein
MAAKGLEAVTTADNILAYAEPAQTGPRPWCRSAVKSLVYVIACPLVVALPLLYAANENWLPQHFLCCNHPEVTVLAFTVMPLAGAVWGGLAVWQILSDARRPRPRGVILAMLAIILGFGLAAMGALVLFALKA